MKKGEKYIIEIEEVHTHVDDNGKKFPLARIKGFSSLVFDQKGLDKLEKVENNNPGRTVPLLNCKFVVLKTTSASLKVGKVYEVKDGKFRAGFKVREEFPKFYTLYSFDELKNYLDISSNSTFYFGGTTEILEIKE